jgi:hypothetical protein
MKTGSDDRMRLEQSMVYVLCHLDIIKHTEAMVLLRIVLRHFLDDYTEED